ncbi:MAG: AI-2E family transporter [Candidatus Nomurabacteria bacterium]|jgi:predicted PurR-regulated permease PerM|nr:AI-2E family transporter [Candidatus Nomurabacteria bacterium]
MKNTEVHISTRTIIRFWAVVIGLAVLALAIYTARWAIVLILTAIFLALVLNRPVEFFARKLPNNSRSLGAAVTFVITLAVVGGAVTLILPILIEQTINFAKSLPDTITSLQNSSKFISDFVAEAGLQDAYEAALQKATEKTSELVSELGSISVAIAGNLINGIGNAVVVLVLTFFMLVEGPYWVEKFYEIAFKNPKKRTKYQSIGDKMYGVITGYVSSQLIAAAITGTLAGAGVFILSLFFAVPTSLILPISAIVFVSAFIPFFGGFIGAATGALLVLLFNPLAASIFVLYMTIIMTIFYNVFSPKIAGKFMRVSALIVLVSLIIGMQISGLFGALVAIPVAGCLVVMFREHLKFRDVK